MGGEKQDRQDTGLKIIVLVKQVPNTSEVKIDPKTGSLIREGVESIMNPEDRCGLEAALRLKERYGGRVTAVTMGPPQAVDVLTEALGMGADEGVLLTDRFFAGADTWATSYTLGLCLKTLAPFDLVVAGRQAIDGDTAQIGPQVAEGLGLPQVTYVRKVDVREGRLECERVVDDGIEKVQTPLPALITVLEAVGEPRNPRIAGLLAACEPKAKIKVLNAADIGARADLTGLAGSYTNVVKTFAPKVKREGEAIEGTPAEMARTLLAGLRARNLV
ncbi:MAG: electron transfer flavoprotein subunit beta/FixA family protein [Thermodesulfobacteriota bacterium]